MMKYMIAVASIMMLAMIANASFPVNDAGIAAYVSVGPNVDLNKTYAAYQDVVDTSQTSIIGTVKIPNLIGDSVPLVYVGADGWIIAYYPKTEPESRIMQWNGYSKPYVNTTTLEDAISKMATALGVNYESIKGNIKYYDFRYPEANLMTMIVETVGGGGGSFNFTIPQTMTLYNVSYSQYDTDGYYWSVIYVDGAMISNIGPSSLAYGYLDITKGVPHKVQTGSTGGASTVLIYHN
jgi:hypothetical protein